MREPEPATIEHNPFERHRRRPIADLETRAQSSFKGHPPPIRGRVKRFAAEMTELALAVACLATVFFISWAAVQVVSVPANWLRRTTCDKYDFCTTEERVTRSAQLFHQLDQ